MINAGTGFKEPAPARPPATSAYAAAVAARFDEIVRRSGRRSWWRREWHSIGAALARLLERAVPPTPTNGEDGLPPQIRFPFF